MKVTFKITRLATRVKAIVAVLGFLVALSAGSVSADTAPGISVSGIVLDRNHAAIPGVTVTASAAAWRVTTRTDGEGNFSFNLAPGDYEITFEAEGFERVSQFIQVKGLA